MDINDKIDTQVGLVCDEFKTLVEQITCNSKMCNNYFIYEARFMNVFADLKKYCALRMLGTKNV